MLKRFSIMKIKTTMAGCFLLIFFCTPPVTLRAENPGNLSGSPRPEVREITGSSEKEIINSSLELIKRILPNHYQFFSVEYLPQKNDKDRFEIESRNNKIILRGNNGVSVASALRYYLNNYAHCQITWNGTNLRLPAIPPMVDKKVSHSTPFDYRYYLNYCTFSYSMVWWDWKRWEKEIDWMAMHGINFPLAVTGQNIIWYRVYRQLGFSEKELSTFFPGPAHFAWFWMGNLDGIGGPLSLKFMIKQEALQKKILKRERSLGMKPILPAFTGHVPPEFGTKFPNSRLKDLEWGRQYHTRLLDPSDPLFVKIGTMFMKEMIKVYGTDHFYSADTFNENTPPTNDSLFLSNVASTVYHSMEGVDPMAVWVMQGWLFVNNPNFWHAPQIQALFNAIPDRRLIVLDLWSETRPVWSRTNAYYDKPWIWCMLQNFGGNVGMFGRMDTIALVPIRTLKDKASGNLVGLGLTPEGIEQNPVMFELMMDNVWRDDPINLDKWLKGYIINRYGSFDEKALKAWEILRRTVYNGDGSQGAPESIITGRPTLKKEPRWTHTELYYDPKELLQAWKLLISCSSKYRNSDGFQYDIVDLSRNVLANYATQLRHGFLEDFKQKNRAAFVDKSKQFMEILNDLDALLDTRKDFLLGSWVNSAIRQGSDDIESKRFEREAKLQITLWGGKDALLHDYANKQWSGLIKSFYKPRWEEFFKYAISCLDDDKPFDEEWFEKQMEDLEFAWVNREEKFNEVPIGNSVKEANDLFRKYNFLLK